MRGLIVGLGSIGRRHARNWATLGLGPLAVCRQLGRPQPEPPGIEASEYHDLEDALAQERPDLVLVTNPTSLHVETACKAVRAGAHVVVEKPLGSSLEGVAQLLAVAHAAGRQLMVAYNLRFHPGLMHLKELVEQNAIGRIVTARADVGEYLPDWHPWEDYRGAYSARRDLGGGAVLTCSHEIDALCWLLGPPRRVTAMAAHASALEIDTEDLAEIVLEFGGGAIGTVHVDYLRRPPKRTIELVGEHGVLRWDYYANRIEHYSVTARQWRVEEGDPRFERNDMYVRELAHVAAVARGEEQSRIDAQPGAAVLAVALAALRAAERGQTIDLGAEGEGVQGWLRSLDQR